MRQEGCRKYLTHSVIQDSSEEETDADKRVSCETSLVFTGNQSCAQRAAVPCALNQPSSLHAHLFPMGSAGMCMTEKITSFSRQGGLTQPHNA